jgi:hypothetical protein
MGSTATGFSSARRRLCRAAVLALLSRQGPRRRRTATRKSASRFGMEDASYANSLQGRTVSRARQHRDREDQEPANPKEELNSNGHLPSPEDKQFELFAEGGATVRPRLTSTAAASPARTGAVSVCTTKAYRELQQAVRCAIRTPRLRPCRTRTSGRSRHLRRNRLPGRCVPKEFHDQYIGQLAFERDLAQDDGKGSSFTAEHGGDLLISNDVVPPVDCYSARRQRLHRRLVRRNGGALD